MTPLFVEALKSVTDDQGEPLLDARILGWKRTSRDGWYTYEFLATALPLRAGQVTVQNC